MVNLAKRNLKLYLRQKSMAVFSLLGVFIILGLYMLFLGDVWLNYTSGVPDAANLLNSWIVAGVVSVASITATVGAAGLMVEDKVRCSIKDFYTSPVKKSSITGGYLLTIFVVGFAISLLAFFVGECYIVVKGGAFLAPLPLLKMVGVIALSTFSSSAMVFFITGFIKTNGAFSTLSTLIGSLIGFLTGIYLPLGTLPAAVQLVVKLFPVSHASALMRKILMEQPMADSFAGAPQGVVEEFRQFMGIDFAFGGQVASVWVHVAVLAGVAALFYLLALVLFSRKKG